MAKNDSLFYFSGFLSFLLFTAVVALFAYVLVINDTIKNFALQKDNYISVSLTTKPMQSQQKSNLNQEPPKPEVKKEPAPETSSDTPPKPADIKSLFSDVATKNVVHDKHAPVKQIDTKQIKQIQKRIQTSAQQKASAEATQKLAAMKLATISSDQKSSPSTALEVNKYLARIQAAVYEHFYPPLNSEGNSAKIRIWLDASGRVQDYRVLVYSAYDAFNTEVDSLKERLRAILFPPNPEGQSLTIDIILMSKE